MQWTLLLFAVGGGEAEVTGHPEALVPQAASPSASGLAADERDPAGAPTQAAVRFTGAQDAQESDSNAADDSDCASGGAAGGTPCLLCLLMAT